MRILLAEDDPNISTIAQLCLEKIGGHNVVICSDGSQALQTALTESFDLILLDGMMPKKSGLDVARSLKESKPGFSTPIIFLSARTDEKEIRQYLELGCGYLAKPFEPQNLCANINQILLRSRSGAA